MPKPNEPDIEHDIVVKMKPKAVRKLLLGAAIQTPTETTCWDGGEHKWGPDLSLSGMTARMKLCHRCGAELFYALGGPKGQLLIPTMFEALSQRKDETDAD